MAARRLLIVMLILLGISSVVAVIIPNPRRDARQREALQTTGETGGEKRPSPATGSADTATTTPADGGSAAGQGETVPAETGSGGTVRAALRPTDGTETVRAAAGGHLILTVAVGTPSQVLIPALGRTAFADRWAPAYFDLILPDRAGSIPVYTAPPGDRPRTRRAMIKVGG